MQLKGIVIFFLFFGQISFAQKFLITPNISYVGWKSKLMYNSFQHSNFSTTYLKDLNFSLQFEFQKKSISYILQVSDFDIAFNIRNGTGEKNKISDFLFSSVSSGTKAPGVIIGAGIKYDIKLKTTNNLYITALLNLGVSGKKDIYGTSSGYIYPSIFIDSTSLTRYDKYFPIVFLQLSHPIKNAKNKEIISLHLSSSFSFYSFAKEDIFYRYLGSFNSTNVQQKATISNNGFSIQVGISKSINLKKL